MSGAVDETRVDDPGWRSLGERVPALGRAAAVRFASMPAEGWITLGVLTACTLFVLLQLQPRLLLTDTTPAGGDMGAHVWAPAFLRDTLLPQGRLSGWTPDWYAGFPAFHFYMVVPSLAIVVLASVIPYGIAFKLVTVAGVLTLPAAAWAFGRLAGLRFPAPALLAAATLPFLFDRSYTIYGGNIPSTLAGEFAFSISLSLALVYLGVVVRGLETGRHRALAAVLLALVGLVHLIPAFFALAGTAIAIAFRPGKAQLRWLLTMGPVAAALAAFWVLPFWWRRQYLNDMGWEKTEAYWENLVPRDMRWALALALVGAIIAVISRNRTGLMLAALTTAMGFGFVIAPQGRLWNARLLPFYYLCIYLLAAFAVSEVGRTFARQLARDVSRPVRGVTLAVPMVATLAVLVLVALPLHALPFGRVGSDGTYRWLAFSTTDRSFVDSWAVWNYTGYEQKDAYPEYRDLVETMAGVGDELGCGRAMWEYERELDRFGTPMALMLLPHWTDGCIGSMEGLYFEASATTPYHFLNQSELSVAPSRAQRDLPYRSFDIDRGVEHLQLMGVRYYMAFSETSVGAARQQPDLQEIASTGSWVVFEVAGSEIVVGLENQPVVLDGVGDAGSEWLDPSVDFYQDPSQWDVFRASDGPSDWARISDGDEAPRNAVDAAEVTNVETGTNRISFDVDRIGSPVLVKASYFPNWQVSGADGPYRVTPNLMVVVPTDTNVELTYGTTPIDVIAWLLTVVGVVGAIVLARRPPLEVEPSRWGSGDRQAPPAPEHPGPDAPSPPEHPGPDPSEALVPGPPDPP